VTWQQVGPGGGGRTLIQAISPSDPKTMFMANDMGAMFRSRNAGESWELIGPGGIPTHWSAGRILTHPTRSGLIFLSKYRGFFRSRDDGSTWESVPGSWDETREPRASRGPHFLVFDPVHGNVGAMAHNAYRQRDRAAVFLTRDAGESWSRAKGLGELTEIRGLHVGEGGGCLLVATKNAVLRSGDLGEIWEPCELGSKATVTALAGGAGATGSIAYVATAPVGGRPVLHVSRDGGQTWRAARSRGFPQKPAQGQAAEIRHLRVCRRQPEVAVVALSSVYPRSAKVPVDAPGHHQLYRTTDGGETWRAILFRHPDMKACNITTRTWLTDRWGSMSGIASVAACDRDPQVLGATDWARNFRSDDGGKTWRETQSHRLSDAGELLGTGTTPVLNVNGYHIHPTQPNVRFLSTMDFWGFASRDGGKTWHSPPLPRIGGNFYAILMDPAVPGRVWAGGSAFHDIPLKRGQYKKGRNWGGIVRTDDFGDSWSWDSWQEDVGGLPKGLVSGLVLDPESPVSNRRLWAAVFGQGVFESSDHGRTWENRTAGIAKEHLDLWGLHLTADGRFLFALCRNGGGAVYRSADGGRTWTNLLSVPIPHIWGFAVHPSTPDTILIASTEALTNPQEPRGVWRTLDGGESWARILAADCSSVIFDPHRPERIYAAGYNNAAIYVSEDGGGTWQPIPCPFWRPKALAVDPADPRVLYVATSGCSVLRATRRGPIGHPSVPTAPHPHPK
jgi:photosystem II stability/assembly factor-like uncharacterized protein